MGIIVSDTTPIISLLKINHLNLLEKMFGDVFISEGVFKELTGNPKYQKETKQIKNSSFIQIFPIVNQQAVIDLIVSGGLDLGESEAIVLAKEIKASTLIIDERRGRAVAEKEGLAITGTIGILLEARKKNIISLEDSIICIDELRKSGIRIGEAVYQRAIATLKSF